MIVLVLCSMGWGLVLLLALGTLMATVSVATGKGIRGERANGLLMLHIAFFPVTIISVVAAWLIAAFGMWTLAYILLALPLINILAFALRLRFG